MISSSKQTSAFIDDLKKLCKKHDVKLRLLNQNGFRVDGRMYGGCFSVSILETKLTAAIKNDWAIDILVHESCHLDQWLEDPDLYLTKAMILGLAFQELNKKRRNKNTSTLLRIAQSQELDCEKRTVKKFKKYGIPVDIKAYKQRANAYIYFYTWLGMGGTWPKHASKSPTSKELCQLMSTRFLSDYSTIPAKILPYYEKLL